VRVFARPSRSGVPNVIAHKEMSMTRKPTTLIAIVVLAAGTFVFGAGCKKKPPTTTEETRPPVEAPPSAATPVAPPTTPAPSRDVQQEVLSQDLAELNRKGYLQDTFFDYDQADLRDDARTALAANAEWLKKFPSVQVLVEGHCDERGTNEYNLALGDRRANAAKEYLASLGVDSSRVRTVSYGEERPFCNESAESCWQQNRRGHFVITAK
jgi:peptidoglycan-associated lipoprotein